MGFNKTEEQKAKEILENNNWKQKSDGRFISDTGKIGVFSDTGKSVKVDGHTYNSTSDLNKRKW